jgi:hypothetical protein
MKPNTIVIAPLIGVTLTTPLNPGLSGATVTTTEENKNGVDTKVTDIVVNGTPPLSQVVNLLVGKKA